MQSVAFPAATGRLRAPVDWSPNARLGNGMYVGPCADLPFRNYLDGDLVITQSFWIPTPEELVAMTTMANGAWAVSLEAIGSTHPPVRLSVRSMLEVMAHG